MVILPWPAAAHAVALLGVRQDHGRLAAVRGRRGVGGMDLHQVVAAALEAVDLLVGHALREARELLVLAEEVVAVEAAVLGGEGLHLAVDRVGEGARQRAAACRARTGRPSRCPRRSLMTFQPAPRNSFSSSSMMRPLPRTGPSSRCRLQLTTHTRLSSFSRAASVSALIDLGLVHLAVAEHAPDLAAARSRASCGA